MKTLIIIGLILAALITLSLRSQTYSDINFNSGTTVEVQTGADVCATNIYINGTWMGSGTICLGPLPVSLSSFIFSVINRSVSLKWTTEWELNNKGFDIERMHKNENNENEWVKIAFVEGNGTINEPNTYTFIDNKLSAGKYKYRLKQIDYNGGYEYYLMPDEVIIAPPKEFTVSQNYPNPSNPKCKIDFELPFDSRVTIKVYDILGREVIVLIDEIRPADYYSVGFDGSNLASGIYFYRITSMNQQNGSSFTKTMKMVLVK